MAEDRMGLSQWLRKVADGADVEFLREGVRMLAQALMELEVSERTGAAWGERSAGRVTHRNGYRPRSWETQVGALELRIPKLREGSYLPSLLEPRRRSDRALAAVIQEAYVHGVSTRKVDEIVRALGMTGISAQSVSRLCSELDASLAAFLSRPLERRYPYLWLDATYLKVRCDGRVLSQACVIAIGVTATGEREILGCEVGPSEGAAFWGAFLRALVERGLAGTQLVVSDAHGGLRGAVEQVLSGAAWQRSSAHPCSGRHDVVRMLPRWERALAA